MTEAAEAGSRGVFPSRRALSRRLPPLMRWLGAAPPPPPPRPATQFAAVLLWIFVLKYYIYSACIALMTGFSIVSSAVEAHRNMRRLADIACFRW